MTLESALSEIITNLNKDKKELLDALVSTTDILDAELHDVLTTHEYKCEVTEKARTVIAKFKRVGGDLC